VLQPHLEHVVHRRRDAHREQRAWCELGRVSTHC
jgi:hypothetical protein